MSPARRDRGRGPGAGDLHADAGLRARLPRVPGQGAAGLRGRLTCSSGRSSRIATASSRRSRARTCPRRTSRPRRALPRARARARARRLAAARGRRAARRAHALPRARDARPPRRARRLRVRHAGPRRRADLAVRLATTSARATCPAVARGREDRRVRAVGARRRLGRGGDDHAAPTAGASPAPRPGSPTAGSPTSTPSSRARREGISAYVVEASRGRDRRAHRRDRAAPAGHAARSTTRPRELLGPPGKGMQIALGDARRLPLDGRRGRARASPGGRSTRRSGACASATLFGAPMAELPLVQAKLAEMALGVDASALLVYRAAWTKDDARRRA